MKTIVRITFIFLLATYTLKAQSADEKVALLNFQEDTYLHLNKSYFYPSERVWLKVYMLYANPKHADSLSKILYLDVVSPNKKIILSQTLKINNREAVSDFRINDSLQMGTYFIRLYTNFMRNFGDEVIQYFPFYVIDKQTLPAKTVQPKECNLIETDATIYQPKQEVKVKVNIENLQSYSVSVVDTFFIKSIENEPFSLKMVDELKNFSLKFPIERNFVLKGKVIQKKPEVLDLNIFFQNTNQFFTTKTNNKGEFEIGLDTDISKEKIIISFANAKPLNAKIEWLEPEKPPIRVPTYKELGVKPFIRTTFEKDTINVGNSISLEEVRVKARKNKEIFIDKDRLYGRPDAVISGQTIIESQALNPLEALQGRVPGVRVFRLSGRLMVDIRGSTNHLDSKKFVDPLILVDGMPYLFNTLDELTEISPALIDRIEVKRGASALYGSRGANGIIAIYTKASKKLDAETMENSISNEKLTYVLDWNGFSENHTFPLPNSTQPDERKVIFWLPNGNTETKEFTFRCADIPTTYRIELVGIQTNGNIVKCVKNVLVERK